MRNPNHYGTVTKLSGKRRKPWVAREGTSGRQHPIGYAETREEAMILLAEYNSEPWNLDASTVTFEQLYELWKKRRAYKLGASYQHCLYVAHTHCKKLYNLKYKDIKSYQMQNVIDDCERSYSTKSNIKSLFKHLDKYAFELEIISKMNSTIVIGGKIPDLEKKIFTEDEICRIWEHEGEWIADCTLILLYTGFRIMELLSIPRENVDLDNEIIKGGIKTSAGKNRIVPIHPRIKPIIERMMGDCLIGKFISDAAFRWHWKPFMEKMGMQHTPHECRHTFRSRMDSADANKVCIDLIMGHKSRDVGERVYTHKTIEELKEAIRLIK